MWRISETRAVAVVGRALDEDRDAARAVALEGELLVGRALELARALLDGALDVVGGHVRRPWPCRPRCAGAGSLSGSPPPMRAAIVISRMILVKTLPRLASSAPFLCLIECPFGMSGHGASPALRRFGSESSTAGAVGPSCARKKKAPAQSAPGPRIEMKKSRQRPTLPPGYPGSTIGAGGLNGRVRNGNGCDPSAMVTGMNYQDDDNRRS